VLRLAGRGEPGEGEKLEEKWSGGGRRLPEKGEMKGGAAPFEKSCF